MGQLEDIVEQGVDLAFRIGHMQSSSLQARKIAPIKHALCASSQYFKLHGEPKTPNDLKQHRLLRYGSLDQNTLKFLNETGYSHGITFLPSFNCLAVACGKNLSADIKKLQMQAMHVYAVYTPNRYLPIKVRSLIDFLAQRFGDKPYWDDI